MNLTDWLDCGWVLVLVRLVVLEADWSFTRALAFSHGASKSFRADQAGVVLDTRLHWFMSSGKTEL